MTGTDVSSLIGEYMTYIGFDQFNIDYPILYTYVHDDQMTLCCEVDRETSYEDIYDGPFLPVAINFTDAWEFILHKAYRESYNMIFFDENESDVW